MHFVGEEDADGDKRSALNLCGAVADNGKELGGGALTDATNFAWLGTALKKFVPLVS